MKKISLLATILLGVTSLWAQQPTTMIMKTANGAVVRTNVNEVEKITFADTTYNLNKNGYWKPTSCAGPTTACCRSSPPRQPHSGHST